MKIFAKTLANFVKKTTLDANIESVIYEFTPDGLVCKSQTPDQIAYVIGLLKRDVFTDYKSGGILPIKNTSMLKNILSNFNENMEIESDSKILKLSDATNSAEVILSNPEFVESALKGEPNLTQAFDGGFSVNSEMLSNSLKNRQTLKTNRLTLVVKNKKFSIIADNDVNDKLVKTSNADYKNVKTLLGSQIDKIIPVLEGSVTVSFKDNHPVLIKESAKDYIIKYVVAPILDNDKKVEEPPKEIKSE